MGHPRLDLVKYLMKPEKNVKGTTWHSKKSLDQLHALPLYRSDTIWDRDFRKRPLIIQGEASEQIGWLHNRKRIPTLLGYRPRRGHQACRGAYTGWIITFMAAYTTLHPHSMGRW